MKTALTSRTLPLLHPQFVCPSDLCLATFWVIQVSNSCLKVQFQGLPRIPYCSLIYCQHLPNKSVSNKQGRSLLFLAVRTTPNAQYQYMFFGWIHKWKNELNIFESILRQCLSTFTQPTGLKILKYSSKQCILYVIHTHLSLAPKTLCKVVPSCLPGLILVSLDWAHLSSYFCFSLSPDQSLIYVCLLKLYPSFTTHSKNFLPVIFSILSTP